MQNIFNTAEEAQVWWDEIAEPNMTMSQLNGALRDRFGKGYSLSKLQRRVDNEESAELIFNKIYEAARYNSGNFQG